jgi:hypothetical protein
MKKEDILLLVLRLNLQWFTNSGKCHSKMSPKLTRIKHNIYYIRKGFHIAARHLRLPLIQC